ncbi:MAG: hypothetical protein ACRDD8_02705, partial [Bacteroidales bacterium]
MSLIDAFASTTKNQTDTLNGSKYDDVTYNSTTGQLTFKANGVNKTTVQSSNPNLVKLDNESKESFNFIGNKLVQDGLIDGLKDKFLNNTTIIAKCNEVNTNDWIFMHAITDTGGYGVWNDFKYGLKINFSNGTVIKTEPVWNKSVYNFVFILNGNIATFYNEELGFKQVILNGLVDKNAIITKGASYSYERLYVYNRQLTPLEIQHNLSVLNNSPSLKSLETTDTTGKKQELLLATDSDHVEMSTGRTLEQEYMGVLKTLGKEFASADGADVTVANGIGARVIGAEIQGQTVKNVFNINTDIYYRGGLTKDGNDIIATVNSGGIEVNSYNSNS